MKPRVLFAALCLAAAAACAVAAEPAKKRVLILGDSISIGYMPELKKLLAEEAIVVRPKTKGDKPENCQGTNYGVTAIDRWLTLDGGRWDVIHFNFGLHDLKHVKPDGAASNLATDPPQASLEAYEKQLRQIVEKLKATGATLIFATTTPVPEGKLSPWRSDADVVRYNDAARRVMKEHNIGVNDLYAFCKPRLAELQLPANVHFKPDGSKALAEQVAKAIGEAVK